MIISQEFVYNTVNVELIASREFMQNTISGILNWSVVTGDNLLLNTRNPSYTYHKWQQVFLIVVVIFAKLPTTNTTV